MSWWVYVPLLLSGVFGLAAPALAGRLPPWLATWLLSGGGLLSAAASSASIALLAFLLIAQSPLLVERGHWSDDFLRGHDQYAAPVGVLACALVVVLSVRFVRAAARRLAAVRDAYRLAAALPAAGGELCVLNDSAQHAFAVPGRPGRIVVTTGMLRSLDGGQRRALLAHERAHLVHRHYLHQSAGTLAVAVNPLLARLPAALALSCERWADEDAAHVCRRVTVASTLTTASTAVAPGSAVVLAAGGADVLARIDALHAPAPRLIAWRLATLAGLLLATGVAVAVAMRDVERLFELAQSAYRLGQR
ncbi:MAG: M56 family metallopeptidase [Jatrophihabitantaceae bacterium]